MVDQVGLLLGLYLVILVLTVLGVIVTVIQALAATFGKHSLFVLIHHMVFRTELIMLHLLVAI